MTRLTRLDTEDPIPTLGLIPTKFLRSQLGTSNWSNDIHVPEPLHETHQELLSNKDFAMEAIEINGLQGQEWRFT